MMKGGTSQNLSNFYFHNSWIYVEIMTRNVNFPIGPVHYLACQTSQGMYKVALIVNKVHMVCTLVSNLEKVQFLTSTQHFFIHQPSYFVYIHATLLNMAFSIQPWHEGTITVFMSTTDCIISMSYF